MPSAGADLPEEASGRVYIQRLSTKSHSEIAILFDKLSTPGGDYCRLPYRLWPPLGREVCFEGPLRKFSDQARLPRFAFLGAGMRSVSRNSKRAAQEGSSWQMQ
jgi:hypothetical protein